ncbi:hypothetical protein B0H19DRAFT_1102762 [Mycena capillaripes]|nr:hypothetical protein B0H19DRAFT_1102762 [Mycena capillaripes]
MGNTDSDLSLVYGGITIGSTPLGHLEDDLQSSVHARFINTGAQLRWRAFHIPGMDEAAPNGPLDFRCLPQISRWEGLAVNCLLSLGINTMPGGSWIPTFTPSSESSLLVESALKSLPAYLSVPEGLDNSRCQKLTTLLDEEYRFWPKEEVCVPKMLASIKFNMIEIAWTVRGTVVNVTVMEDITEEERDGRIGGIESDTTGPAMKEAAHTLSLVRPSADFSTISDLRQYRVICLSSLAQRWSWGGPTLSTMPSLTWSSARCLIQQIRMLHGISSLATPVLSLMLSPACTAIQTW